jgi:hypothetical protein
VIGAGGSVSGLDRDAATGRLPPEPPLIPIVAPTLMIWHAGVVSGLPVAGSGPEA